MSTATAIRRAARSLGVDLVRYPGSHVPSYVTANLLSQLSVDLVVDVGANIGQFAQEVRKIGYRGRIISIEPMSEAYAALERSADTDPRWVVIQSAVGSTTGSATLNIAGNSASSSILEMQETHTRAAPGSAYVTSEDVRLDTLDNLLFHEFEGAGAAYLKVDTQGFEAEVIRGAVQSLEYVCGLQLELSLVPLYSGGPLFKEMMEMVDALGFSPWWLDVGFKDPETGRALQVDGWFTRDPGGMSGPRGAGT